MLARLTPLLLLSLLTALTACYEAPEDPVPDGKEAELTTVTSQLDEACYGSCAERSAAVYDRCIERGHSRGYCGGLVYDQWRHCNDRCDQPADCEEQCERRGAQYLRACSRRGVPRDRCETQARRLTRSCVHRVCEERVDIPPCARRCQRRAYKVLRRCLRRGGHPNVCGRYAGAHFDSCVQRTCEIPTCDEIRCPDGHHCEMNDEGPACVADPEPRTCDEVQCVEGTHCVMHDDGPQCVRNAPTCDDVDCPDAHHCEMSDGQPVCVPDHVPSCEERCDRAAAQVYQHCTEGGEAPDVCRERAEEHADACVADCPRAPETCDDVACPDEHHCQVMDGQAVCVPDRLQRSCENTVCPPRHHCHETDNGPVCARDHGCEDTICPDGWSCDEIEGIAQCFDGELSCLQLCHRRREARFYNCVHHERRDVDACAEEADGLRAACANHCHAPPEPTCDDIRCPEGHSCEMLDNQPTCIEDEVGPSCENTVCPPRHHCHETDHGPVCARDHGCEDTICPDGWSCEEMEGIAQCFDGEPTCVQRCYRRRDARYYNCVHHDLEDADVCAEQAEQLRAECVNHCG